MLMTPSEMEPATFGLVGDGFLPFMNGFRANMLVRNEVGITQEYVTEEIDYLSKTCIN